MSTTTSTLADAILALQAAVQAETSAEQSAITLINGIPAMITNAVAAAEAQGATPAQLSEITAVATALQDQAVALAAAMASAGTNPAPTSTPPPAPTPTV